MLGHKDVELQSIAVGTEFLNESLAVYGAQQFALLRIIILGKFAVNTYGVVCIYTYIHTI